MFIYNAVLTYAIQQSYSNIYIYIYALFIFFFIMIYPRHQSKDMYNFSNIY